MTDNQRDNEGRVIAALRERDLAALEARCASYAKRCESAGKPQAPEYAAMCSEVDAEVIRRASRPATISEAFNTFSLLFNEAKRVGYDVPSIEGTPGIDTIHGVCLLLRDALRGGEVGAEQRAVIDAEIDRINGG